MKKYFVIKVSVAQSMLEWETIEPFISVQQFALWPFKIK